MWRDFERDARARAFYDRALVCWRRVYLFIYFGGKIATNYRTRGAFRGVQVVEEFQPRARLRRALAVYADDGVGRGLSLRRSRDGAPLDSLGLGIDRIISRDASSDTSKGKTRERPLTRRHVPCPQRRLVPEYISKKRSISPEPLEKGTHVYIPCTRFRLEKRVGQTRVARHVRRASAGGAAVPPRARRRRRHRRGLAPRRARGARAVPARGPRKACWTFLRGAFGRSLSRISPRVPKSARESHFTVHRQDRSPC